MKLNVCAYARVSTKEDLQQHSLDNQASVYINEIIENENYNYCGIYIDSGKSGTSTFFRDEFNDMIEAARNGAIDKILVKSISRFSRNTVDALSLIRELRKLNVEVYFERENISSFDLSIDMMLSIMSAFAEEEARQTSENIKWSHRVRMRKGKYTIPTKLMLGFKYDENNKLVINEDEAKTIRLIYELYLKGYGLNKIGRYLKEKGIKTSKGNETWSNASISSILSNEKYKGDALLQKSFNEDFRTSRSKVNNGELPSYLVKNGHPAIISDEMFDQVQKLREKREIKYGVKTRGSDTIYTSFLRCAKCNKNYYLKKNAKGNWYSVKNFICMSKTVSKTCDANNVSFNVFNEVMLDLINSIIKNKRTLFKNVKEDLEKNANYIKTKNTYDKLKARISDLKEKLANYTDTSNELEKALISELKAKIRAHYIDLGETYKLLATTYNIEAFIKRKRALLDPFNEPIKTLDEFPIKEFFSHVYVHQANYVTFHLGFDNETFNDTDYYLEGEIPYLLRTKEKIFKYKLMA